MTLKRKTREIQTKVAIVSIIALIWNIPYYFYVKNKTSIHYSAQIQNLQYQKEELLSQKKDLLSKKDFLTKQLQDIQNQSFDPKNVEVVVDSFLKETNKITFATTKLLMTKKDDTYSNIVHVSLSVKSNLKGVPDNLAALGLLEIFKKDAFIKIFKPLKNNYTINNNIISFIYYQKMD